MNGNSYVGSSSSLTSRLQNYYNYNFISNPKHNMPIYRALLSYGYSNFKLEILEYCNKDEVITREQYYLDLLLPEYNILKTAANRLGSKHSESTKEKIKNSHKLRLELSEKAHHRLGSSHSEESKAIMREAAKKRFTVLKEKGLSIPHSEERKVKLRISAIKIPVEVTNLISNETVIYPSMKQAASIIGVEESTVRRALKRDNPVIKKTYKVSHVKDK
jgi:group I intron endonuclease